MKTMRRFLCHQCAEDIKAAQLVYEKAPGKSGEKYTCDWCRRSCYGDEYVIRYGRGKT